MDVGTSELDEDVRIARIEAVKQAERQDVGVDHARSDTLTERGEEGREMREP